jgi:hypothetical protein
MRFAPDIVFLAYARLNRFKAGMMSQSVDHGYRVDLLYGRKLVTMGGLY